MSNDRKSWDVYFMAIARVIATRATCDRKHVGAVIVRDRVILSTGYNGSVRGQPHCTDVGHLMEDGHCVRTVHAEANAIIQAAKNGVEVGGADLYVTASPCWNCFKLIANSGIKNVYFGEAYRLEDKVAKTALESGIRLIDMSRMASVDVPELFKSLTPSSGWVPAGEISLSYGETAPGQNPSSGLLTSKD